MHAQGTWRLLVGPQGGSWLLVENMPLVLDVLKEVGSHASALMMHNVMTGHECS